jgi:CheY-like chemotaxis protein
VKKEIPFESVPTILVVEDDVLIRMPIASYLRECGYRVVEAADADEALTVLAVNEIQISVVFAAAELTGSMDGFSLCQWVHKNLPGTKTVLAGTPKRAADIAGELCEEGSQAAKPYASELVEDLIRRLLATRTDTS